MAIGLPHHRPTEPVEVTGTVAISGGVDGGTFFTSASVAIGDMTISPTTTEIKVGVSRLANRKQLYVLNDSSSLCYINFTNPIVINDRNYVTLLSGEEVVFTLDPTVDEAIYIRTEEITTDIRIIEVK